MMHTFYTLIRLLHETAIHLLMIGDAPSDQKAAENNGILYYPILAGKETSSWRKLVEESYFKFWEGTYSAVVSVGKYLRDTMDILYTPKYNEM